MVSSARKEATATWPVLLRITLRSGGGAIRPPPRISARSGPIFKPLDSMVFSAREEATCKMLLKSTYKNSSYASFEKKRHARPEPPYFGPPPPWVKIVHIFFQMVEK